MSKNARAAIREQTMEGRGAGLSAEIERFDVPAVADVQVRSHERRRRPGDAFEHRGLGERFEFLRAYPAEGQRTILIGEDDA
jgi:hypothetical protein